jgi:hypothetical protein
MAGNNKITNSGASRLVGDKLGKDKNREVEILTNWATVTRWGHKRSIGRPTPPPHACTQLCPLELDGVLSACLLFSEILTGNNIGQASGASKRCFSLTEGQAQGNPTERRG